MNAGVLATINIVVQVLLMVVLVYAGYLAKKKQVNRHCTVMRFAVVVQFIAVFAVMWPAMSTQLAVWQVPPPWGLVEVLVHHGLGLLAVVIWVFANLVSFGVIKFQRRLRWMMRVAAVSWVASFILGAHLYAVIQLGVLTVFKG